MTGARTVAETPTRGGAAGAVRHRASRRADAIGRAARTGAVVGAGALTAGSLVAAAAYAGRRGEAYSPLNHWVSELGERGVSSMGWAFNVGLIVGGIGFVVFMAGLALTARDRLRFLYGPVGIAAGVAGSLVGVFPMNERATHGLVALLFFNLGWIAVALASVPVAVGHDRRFPRWLPVIGGLTVLAFLAFLYELRDAGAAGASAASLAAPVARPDVWRAPILEWAVIVGIIGWTLLAALSWRRPAEPEGT